MKGYKWVENIPEQHYCVCLTIMGLYQYVAIIGFPGAGRRGATKFVAHYCCVVEKRQAEN